MKVEWIATFLIALIGTFLMGLSVQTTRELSVTVETIKNRMQSQEDQLAAAKSQMNSVAGELTRIKESQAVVTQQNLQDQVQEIIRLDREKQAALQQEKSRLHKLEDKFKTEKVRIQKLQSQIDLAKQQLDIADKNLEVEILTSVVESSVQKKTFRNPLPWRIQKLCLKCLKRLSKALIGLVNCHTANPLLLNLRKTLPKRLVPYPNHWQLKSLPCKRIARSCGPSNARSMKISAS
jgi:hypothetical protein